MINITDKVELEVIEIIAEGGMGAVYKAWQHGVENFKKTVAVKTLLSEFTNNPKFVKMFKAEALLVANLVHENIVQIYQLGKFENDYYFVLEYVDGISLHDFLEFHNKLNLRMPVKLAVFIASRIARGLAYAHSRRDASDCPLNIVHCDVCPSNILINTEGLPKLTDFGIAKAANMAVYDTVSGKYPYMSPEQAAGKDMDFRSDIYSLGIVLFCMLSGKPTRNMDTTLNNILNQAKDNFIAWENLPDSVDNDLRAILRKMLATNPCDRHQDTAELARDLEYYIYKDGYGPTIVALADYMREQMPCLFSKETDNSKAPSEGCGTSFINRTTKIKF